MDRQSVSVVVCTFNRGDLLAELLASLSVLEIPSGWSYEILIIDNASSDHTQSVIEAAILQAIVPMRSVFEENPGVAYARNRGVDEASGHWIAFVDDDEVADKFWLQQLLEMADAKRCRCVGGAIKLRFPSSCPPEQWSGYRKILGEHVMAQEPFRFSPSAAPGTGNLLLEQSVFEEIGNFNTSLQEGTEDTDLFQRLFQADIEAWYAPKAVVEHMIPSYRLSEKYIRWRSQRNGWGLARKDLIYRGVTTTVISAMARLIQLGLINVPKLYWYKMFGRNLDALFYHHLIWRAIGYVRRVLKVLMPVGFSQEVYSKSLTFRDERKDFS